MVLFFSILLYFLFLQIKFAVTNLKKEKFGKNPLHLKYLKMEFHNCRGTIHLKNKGSINFALFMHMKCPFTIIRPPPCRLSTVGIPPRRAVHPKAKTLGNAFGCRRWLLGGQEIDLALAAQGDKR